MRVYFITGGLDSIISVINCNDHQRNGSYNSTATLKLAWFSSWEARRHMLSLLQYDACCSAACQPEFPWTRHVCVWRLGPLISSIREFQYSACQSAIAHSALTELADHLSCLEKRERESARASVSHFLTRTAVDVSVGVSNSTFHPKCVCTGQWEPLQGHI